MPPPAEGLASRLFLGPALRAQPDRRLVTLVREGYEAAFEEIVRRYGAPLRRYAAAIVGGHAEDVTQDSFSKALLALRRDDTEIELRPWLYRIVRNTALNDLRDRPQQAEALAETIAAGRTPEEELEQREELTDLIQRLQALPEAQRAAIVMRELEGLGHDEIAAALGISGGGARQAIHRARIALRDGLGLLLPLPLLRVLIDHGAEAIAAGAGAGGVAAAGGILGGAGGGTALKAGVVTAVLAGSVGAGVALQEDRGQHTSGGAEATAAEIPVAQGTTSQQATPAAAGGGSGSSSGPGPAGDTRSEDEEARDRGKDPEEDDDRSGPGSGPGEQRSGHDDRGHGSGRGDRGDDDDPHREDGSRSGPGHSDDDTDEADDDHRAHGGGSGSGESGSSSGPGSGVAVPAGDDGADSSGSGSSGSDDDEEEPDDDLEPDD